MDRGDAGAKPVDHLLGVGIHPGLVDKTGEDAESPLHRLAAEEDIGGDVLLLGQRQILIDHLDAAPATLAGAGAVERLTVEPDVAFVERIYSGDGFHQSRLAGPIVADEAGDSALVDRQVDAIQYLHGAETLGDALDFEETHGLRSFAVCNWSIHTARMSTTPIATC